MDIEYDLATSMKSLRDLIIEHGVATPAEILGCDEAEVEHLEGNLSVRLPLAYRLFLLSMGKCAGNLFSGTDIFYERISRFREWLLEAVAESGDNFALPGDAVVFMSHQGVVFMFFRTSDGDDPPVYRYCQGTGAPIVQDQSFIEFLRSAIFEQIEMQRVRRSLRARKRGTNHLRDD